MVCRHAVLALLITPASALSADLPAPLTDADFIQFDPKRAEIGQLLFYDKILSGNRNISCGTCHHHDHGSADGLSLGIGEGGEGVGPERTAGNGPSKIKKRVPRNAPALWNLAHRDVDVMFHDGRLSISDIYGNDFNSPAQEWLPQGLETLLAAQAMFPVTAQFEMAGNPGENDVAGAAHDRIDYVWPILAKRVQDIPAYAEMFIDAYDHVYTPGDITMVEIANALAAFIGTEFRNHDSPFDAYLAGDDSALTPEQMRGMRLFYGAGGCVDCHSGPLLSDQSFHALAVPAFGPGRTRAWDPIPRDQGRVAESDRLEDVYRFRTPMLRNIALTGPYGHNGAPLESLASWTPAMANLPEAPWLKAIDFVIRQDRAEMMRLQEAIDIDARALPEDDIADLVAFLHALTGETAKERPLGRPETVPSGLPVD
jgi:cytochrome c peroxidase